MKAKKIIVPMFLFFITNFLFAQQKEKAEKLVGEGVGYNDKGDYEGAIARYEKALQLDKDNTLALAEMAYTMLAQQKYEESIKYCRQDIEKHPGDEALKSVFVTYGSAYDGLKKTDKSIEVYDEGLKQFPDFFMLYFNKGISLASVKRYDEALVCLQKSAALNPKHAGSNNAIARILDANDKRIPALLAYARFLVIEPVSQRAKENLVNMERIMKGDVKKTGKNSITINVNPSMLGDTAADGIPKENSFTSTDLILAMSAALDYDKKSKKKKEIELFIGKFETVCASLKETQKSNHGFYWNYYVPYFVEMKDRKLVEAFAYIIHSSSDDADVAKWVKSHKNEIQDFYDWSKSFAWKGN